MRALKATMTMRLFTSGCAAGSAMAAAILATAPAMAQAPFYQGKTIQIVVGFGPGGGYDAYARLIARTMGNHIPGNPVFVVQNMPAAEQ